MIIMGINIVIKSKSANKVVKNPKTFCKIIYVIFRPQFTTKMVTKSTKTFCNNSSVVFKSKTATKVVRAPNFICKISSVVIRSKPATNMVTNPPKYIHLCLL